MYTYNERERIVTVHSFTDLKSALADLHAASCVSPIAIAWPEKFSAIGSMWGKRDTTFERDEWNIKGLNAYKYDNNILIVEAQDLSSPYWFDLNLPGICKIVGTEGHATVLLNYNFGNKTQLASFLWKTGLIYERIAIPPANNNSYMWQIYARLGLADATTRYISAVARLPETPREKYDIEKDLKGLFNDKMSGIIMKRIKND